MKKSYIALVCIFSLFYLTSKSQKQHFRHCTLKSASLQAMQNCISNHPNDFGWFVIDLYGYADNTWGLKMTAHTKNGFEIVDFAAPIIDRKPSDIKPEELDDDIAGRYFIPLDDYNKYLAGRNNVEIIPEKDPEDPTKNYVRYKLKCAPACARSIDDGFLNPSPPKPSFLRN